MRPISGTPNPYGPRPVLPHRRVPASAVEALLPSARPVEREVGEVELSVRVFADGGSISVRRRTVTEPDGSRRTVGIDAIIR